MWNITVIHQPDFFAKAEMCLMEKMMNGALVPPGCEDRLRI